MKKLIILTALAWLVIPAIAAAQAQTSASGSDLLAAAAGNTAHVKQLLAAGANIEATNQAGATPLMWAALNGRLDVVALLLKRGANINAKTKSGITALSAAASKGHAEVVKVLLEYRADVHAKNNIGQTALDIAQAGGFAEIANMLKGGGQASAAEAGKPGPPTTTGPPTMGSERPGPVGVVTRVDLPDNCLRIRSGPSTNHEIVGCANQGATLKLTGAVENGWAQVQEPVRGWVSGGQMRAEGLFPAKRATSGYSGPSQGYQTWSDTDAALDRAERQADRDIRRLRSEYPDFGYGRYYNYGPRGGVIVGPRGIGIGIGR